LYAGGHGGRLTIMAEIDPMLTMVPASASTKCRLNTGEQVHSASTFVVITERQSSGVTSRAGASP
jgi:hypothetical protein